MVDVADTILPYTARDSYGMMAHDDKIFIKFVVPDLGYFAVRGIAIGATVVDRMTSALYRQHTIIQAQTFFDTFFDPDKGLTKREIFTKFPGTTYW